MAPFQKWRSKHYPFNERFINEWTVSDRERHTSRHVCRGSENTRTRPFQVVKWMSEVKPQTRGLSKVYLRPIGKMFLLSNALKHLEAPSFQFFGIIWCQVHRKIWNFRVLTGFSTSQSRKNFRETENILPSASLVYSSRYPFYHLKLLRPHDFALTAYMGLGSLSRSATIDSLIKQSSNASVLDFLFWKGP